MAALVASLLLGGCTHSMTVIHPPASAAVAPLRTFPYPAAEYFDPSVTWIGGTASFVTDACGAHEFPFTVGSGMADLLKGIDRASFTRVETLASPAQSIHGVPQTVAFKFALLRVVLGSDRISWGTARRTVEATLQIQVEISAGERQRYQGTVSGRGYAQDLGSVFAGCGAIADLIPAAIAQSVHAAATDYAAKLADPKLLRP